MTDIIDTRWGIGNTVGDQIYLNRNLKDHPSLRDKVLIHEMNHVAGHHEIDLVVKFDEEIWQFIVWNPSSWAHFIPFWKYGKTWTYSRMSLFYWGCLLVGFSFMVWLYYG